MLSLNALFVIDGVLLELSEPPVEILHHVALAYEKPEADDQVYDSVRCGKQF